jgi:hypothetical protein
MEEKDTHAILLDESLLALRTLSHQGTCCHSRKKDDASMSSKDILMASSISC